MEMNSGLSHTLVSEVFLDFPLFLIFLRMRELRESKAANPSRGKKKNQEKPLGPGYLSHYLFIVFVVAFFF